MVSTKMPKWLELTSHLRDDCAFLAQKVGFVRQHDKFGPPCVQSSVWGYEEKRDRQATCLWSF